MTGVQTCALPIYKIDGKEARIAKILIDENGSCLEDLEYIDDLDDENE